VTETIAPISATNSHLKTQKDHDKWHSTSCMKTWRGWTGLWDPNHPSDKMIPNEW